MRKRFKLMLSVLMIIIFTVIAVYPALAFITGRNYGLKEGSIVHWNYDDYYVRSPWDVYFDNFSDHQGTAMNFSKTNTNVDNGYLVVGRDQWDDWVAAFGADYDSVILKIKYTEVDTPIGTVDIAWLTQIANVCGWRVKDWDNAGWAIYEKIPPDPPPADTNEPPTARFTWPSSCYEGDTVTVTDNSFDSDGQVVDWDWRLSPSTGTAARLGDTGGEVEFSTAGTYDLRLTVTDDDGATDSITKSITVKQPKPVAVIDIAGFLKENRKVILDSAGSTSPNLYPIDHTRDEWSITPVSGGSAEDIKTLPQNGTTKLVLFKKPGIYKVGLRVHNSMYPSEWSYQNITIIPDEPPVANFIIPYITFRNPADSSFASITLNDKSFSLDGDIISERIWKYKFDSNNDGSFLDETWAELDTGNNTKPVLRVDHVGLYLFSLEIKETFGQETIPQFITDADYRRADTTTKPEYQKISEVKNIAPVTSFTARTQPKADIVFVKGNVNSSKVYNLENQVYNLVRPKLLARNVAANIQILDSKNLGPNMITNASFEQSMTNWGQHPYLYSEPTIADTGYTGNHSMLIDANGEAWSQGLGQQLYGCNPGESFVMSAYINMTSHSVGQVRMDLYCFDSNGRPLEGWGYTSASQVTSGYQYFESAPFQIPVNAARVYLRVFADGVRVGSNFQDPVLRAYVDDVAVRKVFPNKSIEEVLSEVNWTTDKNRFLVNISDTSNILNGDSFAQNLNSSGINYSVLGTDSNKAESEQIITLNSGKGIFHYNHNMATALDNLGNYISSQAQEQEGESVRYILLDEGIQCTPEYSDYEKDPKFVDNWYYEHDPTYVDNNNGLSFYHQKALTDPLTHFDKYGKYDITYKAMDEPTQGNSLFHNYRLWSDPVPTTIIVHRKPIANFSVQPGTLYVTDLSYDPDFQYKRPDKGIVEWYWKWRPAASSTWAIGKPSQIAAPGNYVIYLKVKDNYGVWSDPVEKTITVTELNKPPEVNFSWSPTVVFEGDNITLINQSIDHDGTITQSQWTIFNPAGNTITKTYTGKVNETILDALPGKYWVTLRVWDDNGATDAITKSVVVGELGITGRVKHTAQWNQNRINYNRGISGTDNSPRPYNMFWAGETFILEADATDTGNSATKAASVKVTLIANGTSAELTANQDKTLWSGEMWQEDFERLPDGAYTFRFTATYSNGVVKTDDVTVTIQGSWQDYFKFHRRW